MDRSRILALCFVLFGCGASEASSGEEGVARVGYADGYEWCERDCGLDTPMAAGATVFVRVLDAHTLGASALRSQDPSVVDVESSIAQDHHVLRAGAAGRTRLELVDDAGAVLDRFPIEVREVEEIRIEGALVEPAPLTTLEQVLRFTTHGGGRRLRGFGAVSYATSPNVAVRPYTLGDRLGRLVTVEGLLDRDLSVERASVTGDMSGAPGHLDVTASGGAHVRLSFDVLAPRVDWIGLSAYVEDNAAHVRAQFDPADAGEGLEACCAWSLEPPDALLYLTRRECRAVRVASTMPYETQHGVVTCHSQGVQASLEVAVYDP